MNHIFIKWYLLKACPNYSSFLSQSVTFFIKLLNHFSIYISSPLYHIWWNTNPHVNMSINYCIFVYCFVLLLRMIIQVPKSCYLDTKQAAKLPSIRKKGSYANVRLTHPGWASRPELASALESITLAFTDTETPKNWVIYDGIYYLFHYIFLAGWPGPWLGPCVAMGWSLFVLLSVSPQSSEDTGQAHIRPNKENI